MKRPLSERAGPDSNGSLRLLVVLTGSLGDLARGLSVATLLKKHLPQVNVTWLVEKLYEPLTRNHPAIDELVVYDKSRGIAGLFATLRRLAALNLDITLDLQRNFRSGLFSLCSRAPRRIGFNRKNGKELNHFFNNEEIGELPEEQSKICYYLKFVEHLTGLKALEPQFETAHLAPSAPVAEVLPRLTEPSVALVLGSSWYSKDWDREANGKLVLDLLQVFSGNIVLLGGRDKSSWGQSIKNMAGSARVLDLTGRTTVADLYLVLKAVKVAAGPDSGPAHIAAAVRTPYIALFGPTSEARTAPYGSEHLVISVPLGCRPCYRRRCPGLNTLCMKLIAPERVLAGLQRCLAEPPRRQPS